MDPNDYRFTKVPLAKITAESDGKKEVARVFLGEWMKLLPEKKPANGRTWVRYRGGKGWVATKELGPQRLLELFFIDVGQGDAILIQTPDDQRVLVDGGPGGQALKFIEGKYRLDKPDNFIDFEAVISTHTDADHLAGLVKILGHPRIGVKRFYHNGLFDDLFEPKKDRVFGLAKVPPRADPKSLVAKLGAAIEKAELNLPKVIAAIQKYRPWAGAGLPPEGFVCDRADAAMGHVPPFGPRASVSLEVVWPEAAEDLSYRWYEDGGKTKNGNSVVLRLKHGANSILLAADVNAASMGDLLAARGAKLRSSVYKVAHHGSQDFSTDFLRAVKPDVAVISSGEERDSVYGHPRAVLLGTVTRYSDCPEPGVFSTELAACYAPLKGEDLEAFNASKGQLYARSIEGVIHLRSDGERLCLGRVFGRKMPDGDPHAATTWKWDVWPRSA